MRLLVLGGTQFLSHEVARQAVAQGHQVVCVARGESGPAPDGAELWTLDRAEQPVPSGDFDAVVDVARHPSWVRSAVATHPSAHWVFISTVNVYADDATPGQTPATGPLVEAIAEDLDLAADPQAYGGMKLACERIVVEGAQSATVIRPGLICGPGDPSGRFTYWPARLADLEPGAAVIAPGSRRDRVQLIDVRDLAEWALRCAQERTVGTFDGVGEPLPMRDFLDAVATECGATPRWVWRTDAQLVEQDVRPWAGERAIPLWLPRPDYDGMLTHDPAPSFAAGLQTRSLTETAADTLGWWRATPDATVTGLTRDEELAVLAADPSDADSPVSGG